jgi:5'-phosphate synthase pdxT subunit
MKMIVGILALQGGYHLHEHVCKTLGYETLLVKNVQHLNVDSLIIPGGESTTMIKILNNEKWFQSLKDFAAKKPVFGTCAGAILLSNYIENDELKTLKAIDIKIKRNAYGRQIESFTSKTRINLNETFYDFEATFIRAPVITATGENVDVLAEHEGCPILVEEKNVLAATFHPELSDDSSVHEYFLSKSIEKGTCVARPGSLYVARAKR